MSISKNSTKRTLKLIEISKNQEFTFDVLPKPIKKQYSDFTDLLNSTKLNIANFEICLKRYNYIFRNLRFVEFGQTLNSELRDLTKSTSFKILTFDTSLNRWNSKFRSSTFVKIHRTPKSGF